MYSVATLLYLMNAFKRFSNQRIRCWWWLENHKKRLNLPINSFLLNNSKVAAADGALEANMKQLEKEPYRRSDVVTRSFKRRQNARAENVKKGASTML